MSPTRSYRTGGVTNGSDVAITVLRCSRSVGGSVSSVGDESFVPEGV